MSNVVALISTTEAAEILGVSRSTVIRMWEKGKIEGRRTSTSDRAHLRLDRTSVEFMARLLSMPDPMEAWEHSDN